MSLILRQVQEFWELEVTDTGAVIFERLERNFPAPIFSISLILRDFIEMVCELY